MIITDKESRGRIGTARKKACLLIPLILIITGSPSFAAHRLHQRLYDTSSLRVVQQNIKLAESWFDQLEGVLKEYYGESSTHERVKGFLDWIKQHRKRLLETYKRELESGKVPPVTNQSLIPLLGFWLGIRYDADHYQLTTLQRFPLIKLVASSRKKTFDNARFNEETQRFEIGIRFLQNLGSMKRANSLIFLRALNIGVHEGGHALGYINAKSGVLSELGVYKIHTSLAVPLRFKDIQDKDQFRFGVRDFNLAVKQFAEGTQAGNNGLAPDYLEAEYLGFILGPWIEGGSAKSDPLNYMKYTQESDETEFTFQDVLDNADQLKKMKDDPDSYVIEGPIDMDWLASQFCRQAGVEDPQVEEKVAKVFKWIEACMNGSACNGEFKGLHAALTVTRNYAEKIERAPLRPTQPIPPKLLRARSMFMKFLRALQSKLTEIFGSPTVPSLPEGFVNHKMIASPAISLS